MRRILEEETAPMPGMLPFTARLRHNRLAAWIGSVLLLVYVLGGAEHMSAAAAAIAGARLDGPLGFLHICTAHGVADLPAERLPGTAGDDTAHACALCAMHCMAGAATAQMPPVFLHPEPLAGQEPPVRVVVWLPIPSVRYGGIRGPPASLLV